MGKPVKKKSSVAVSRASSKQQPKQRSYAPKHWHLPLWLTVFLVFVFLGGIMSLYSSQSSIADSSYTVGETPQTSGLSLAMGQCVKTSVAKIEQHPLVKKDSSVIDGGDVIQYTNGIKQISYEEIPGINNSQVGDPITLCLISTPPDCLSVDTRGREYAATNVRIGESWTAGDSEHMCGGV